MKIDAILTPAELPALAKRDLRETACVVFDVLRATSTFVTALHNGAKAIIPTGEISEALAIRKKQPDVLLGGERDGVKIRAAQTGGTDFDLGNSPREFTSEKVRGRIIVSTTTNGTRALRAGAGAKTVLAGSFLNLGATAEFIRKLQPAEVLLVCEILGGLDLECGDMSPLSKAPTYRRTPKFSESAEIARHFYAQAKSDLAAAVRNATNARRLLAIPELRDDVAFCLQRDIFPLVAGMEADGAIRRQPAR
jgi:2-phosphosulfolactate phosphatase